MEPSNPQEIPRNLEEAVTAAANRIHEVVIDITEKLANSITDTPSARFAAVGVVMNSLVFILANTVGGYLSPFTREKAREVTESIYLEMAKWVQEKLEKHSGRTSWMCMDIRPKPPPDSSVRW